MKLRGIVFNSRNTIAYASATFENGVNLQGLIGVLSVKHYWHNTEQTPWLNVIKLVEKSK